MNIGNITSISVGKSIFNNSTITYSTWNIISNCFSNSIYILTVKYTSIVISICTSDVNILNGSISIGNGITISNSKIIGIDISNSNNIT